MSPGFCGKSWTHIGHMLDSYWTHRLFGVTHLSTAGTAVPSDAFGQSH